MSSQLDGYVLIFKVEVGEPEAKKDSVVDKQVRLGQDSGGRVGPEAGRHGSHEELRDHGYDVSPGTIYPVLHSMEDAELLKRIDKLEDGKIANEKN